MMENQLDSIPHIESLVIPYWKPVAINGKSSDEDFFYRLANNMFNVNVYLRKWDERDYLPTRCRWHDTFGHLPLLWDKEYSNFASFIGSIAQYMKKEDLKYLIRLYWYTIEFSIIMERGEQKALGAGIISSPNEINFAINSDQAKDRKFEFNLDHVIESDFVVDDFQDKYFVIEDFKQVQEAAIQMVKKFL